MNVPLVILAALTSFGFAAFALIITEWSWFTRICLAVAAFTIWPIVVGLLVLFGLLALAALVVVAVVQFPVQLIAAARGNKPGPVISIGYGKDKSDE